MRWRDFDALEPLPPTFFQSPRRVHFIGVGGIGMSALAFALQSRGHKVSGSDANESAMTQKLRDSGIRVLVGHDAAHLRDDGQLCDAVVFGSAISEDNPERVAAQKNGVPQWHRAQILAFFVNTAENSIAVSGTHGKSTTSALIAHILVECGFNPTAILGAEYPPFNSNVRLGSHDLVVVEADESDGSFTLLRPSVAVVTNVEAEHLENYDDSEDELWRAFGIFIDNARDAVILNADDKPLSERFNADEQELSYGLEDGLLQARNILVGGGYARFDLEYKMGSGPQLIGNYALGAPGRHNISNALAAICAATTQDGEFPQAYARAGESLADFYGVRRRFQRIGEANRVLVVDDYAHHPTEVATTLNSAREYLERPIVAVFQPHRYSRTQQMGHEFGPSFVAADRIIVTQLYSAWEEPIEGVSGRIVFDSVRETFPGKDVRYAENLQEARQLALEMAQPGDVVICLGAGDITTLPPLLLHDLQEKERAAPPARVE